MPLKTDFSDLSYIIMWVFLHKLRHLFHALHSTLISTSYYYIRPICAGAASFKFPFFLSQYIVIKQGRYSAGVLD